MGTVTGTGKITFLDFDLSINYCGNEPDFKRYGGFTMSDDRIIEFSKFESIDDFKSSLLHGKEIEFCYNNIEYGVFFEGNNLFIFTEANKPETEIEFCNIDELLDIEVQGISLREIITEVDVTWRNV